MHLEKRGQISTEYLIVVGFVTFLIVSVLGLSLFYSSQIQDRIRFNQLNSYANKVISSSEIVFFSGEPSRSTINAYLPNGVNTVSVVENEIVFNVSGSGGDSIVAYSSDVPLYGFLSDSEGVKRIVITANLSHAILVEG